MEKRLSAIYSEAQKDIQKKADEYFEKFKKADEEKRKLVKQGKLTEDEYKAWRQGKIMYGKRFTDMKEDIAKQLLNVNQTATAYINGELPEVYALNYNALADAVDGVGGYSFVLVDRDTVKNLAMADKSLLPFRELDPAKDIPWNMKKINSQVLQGVIQGESISKIAKRIGNVQEMNKDAAIRSARTIVTGAENKGRMDSYHRAEQDGIILEKEWLATTDSRTRDWHAELDGQTRSIDEPFENAIGKIMFPGDPSADGANVYNCRCTLVSKVKGFKKAQVEKAMGEVERKESKPDFVGITTEEKKIFDSIRNKKKENLVVYDDTGKIVHREGGTKSHTGYENFDYRGLHTVHNHPVGVGYYPSPQDLITFHSSGAKTMTVVSPEHTIKFIRTKNVQEDVYELKSDANYRNTRVYGLESPFGNMSPYQYREKYGLSVRDTNKMKAEYELERIKRIMKKAGYEMVII
jgi:SPP1 gp7 family putative phage head morphogenesis protein